MLLPLFGALRPRGTRWSYSSNSPSWRLPSCTPRAFANSAEGAAYTARRPGRIGASAAAVSLDTSQRWRNYASGTLRIVLATRWRRIAISRYLRDCAPHAKLVRTPRPRAQSRSLFLLLDEQRWESVRLGRLPIAARITVRRGASDSHMGKGILHIGSRNRHLRLCYVAAWHGLRTRY